MSNTFLSQLNWRFATKKFNPVKKVSDKNLAKILEAIQMAPSSMGLQPFAVLVISDEKIKEQLRPVSRDQVQVTDCSHLLIFCADTDIPSHVKKYLQELKKNIPNESVDSYQKSLDNFGARKTGTTAEIWAIRQTYIAFGFALAACAELMIDSCPMEGFEADKVHLALKLPTNLKVMSFLAIGYRLEGPKRPRVRLSKNDLFRFI